MTHRSDRAGSNTRRVCCACEWHILADLQRLQASVRVDFVWPLDNERGGDYSRTFRRSSREEVRREKNVTEEEIQMAETWRARNLRDLRSL